jgi:MAP/microtubule affinity-regulating kinase
MVVIMEYLEGGELAERLRTVGGKFSEDDACKYFK